jgi:hypothetical protein
LVLRSHVTYSHMNIISGKHFIIIFNFAEVKNTKFLYFKFPHSVVALAHDPEPHNFGRVGAVMPWLLALDPAPTAPARNLVFNIGGLLKCHVLLQFFTYPIYINCKNHFNHTKNRGKSSPNP